MTILLVEDNQMVQNAVRETLELEGWRVDVCGDGFTALRKIESSDHYDLILTDNDLPGVSGLELIECVRTLTHRKRTPVIMLSASQHQVESRVAGANEFLRKPEDIGLIVETIKRLLATPTESSY
jgi:two-component system chemotaxis response regulator CheY